VNGVGITLTLTPDELRVTLRAWLMAATMLEALDQDEDARVARELADRVTREADGA
jgi:hypothetical protein